MLKPQFEMTDLKDLEQQKTITFFRKDHTESMLPLRYQYNICQIIPTNEKIILIKGNDAMLSPVSWKESDEFLFRLYLNEKFNKLPIFVQYKGENVANRITDEKKEQINNIFL